MTVELTPAPERTTWRSLPPLALVPIAAVVWWVVGFLPWILDGLGPDVPAGASSPVFAIPLYAGHVGELVVGAGLGGVAAGLLTLCGTGPRTLRAAACAVGVTGAVFITVLQSRSAVNGFTFLRPDTRITNGLSVVVILTALVGLGLGLLALVGRIGVGLALAAVAGAVPSWLLSVHMAIGVNDLGSAQVVTDVSRWGGAAVLAFALVVIGMQPALRLVAWPGAVLVAWFVGPTITAASYMEVFLRPGMGLPDLWGEPFSAAADVWRLSASPDLRPLASWITAIVVAAAYAGWRTRSLSRAPAP
ncbi:hypothetical protein ASE12_04405 [Aeromicrobium sp. Root236]|uniref:hypothetical protein n=1 Tax=Aeromicrobium sp. Root236 TaxID=1736498 RepID=UPI0006F9D583|nr:hypothetical protein [Aeromicrobium sp. Root236]KRC64069.1 hypothetical protein ASE12_04405 [Aeromicrobium sp. Root236]